MGKTWTFLLFCLPIIIVRYLIMNLMGTSIEVNVDAIVTDKLLLEE